MLDEVRTPRLVIAGTASNVGKTILTAGLIAAFKARGLTVQSFKVGPDYIDPAYLAHVSGRPCRNLDSWMLGEGALRQVLAQGALGADLALVEGMMGLFDGRGGTTDGSTADVARIIKAPVVLVIDVASMGESAAAVALGFKNYSESPKIAGVLLNNVGSEGHRRSVEDAIWDTAKLPVLGALRTMPALDIPQRQLGLLPVTENKEWNRMIGVLSESIARDVDLDLLLRIANKAELVPLVLKIVFLGTPDAGRRRDGRRDSSFRLPPAADPRGKHPVTARPVLPWARVPLEPHHRPQRRPQARLPDAECGGRGHRLRGLCGAEPACQLRPPALRAESTPGRQVRAALPRIHGGSQLLIEPRRAGAEFERCAIWASPGKRKYGYPCLQGLLPDPGGVADGIREGDQVRLPTAGSPVPPGCQQGPEGDRSVQADQRSLRGAERCQEADEV